MNTKLIIMLIKKGKIMCDVSMEELKKKNVDLEEFYLSYIEKEGE